jgi:hypothetical protein
MLVQNVYGLHIMKENLFYWLSKKIKQFLIVISYEIEREGPVQEINYASETESGYLRLVSEDEIDRPRQQVPPQQKQPAKKRVKLPSPPRFLLIILQLQKWCFL